ncbi:4-hydroxy-tetrahydrodipicolinate synthase [Duganella violaceipulchra]|uniref:4-hydroxy-tetrahydrodipicolinate synthase n=1 Tax=Duganella violaceipulchra TaxID=2849652 RepID=A0AA41H3Q4_9BURK|nr:4-hydroxy-tetrahydrodipicolinate synthase [Duganella violaceicalia]MBV6320227.1 4-hydroxy-tetrahydrodipicolinate synthase [Duganella violaceicalia]MCP2011675.1 4-hydroxy-tetrahydrodipicolinate synthase [Duganella violaceicalia]
MLTSLHGIWVPLVTPMHHGEIDLPRLQNLAADLVNQGVHGLVVCGTTGEAPQLDLAEQGAALAAVLEAAHKRCPVLMGIGGSDTYAAASRVLQFDDLDLAGYLVSTPAYVRPSQEGLVRHFETIAASTGRPIVLYNVPARTGVNLELATASRLAERPQFAAIKEAGGRLRQITDLVEHTPLSVLCGDDALLLSALCSGAHGAISASAHIRVDLFVQLYELVEEQRLPEARELFARLQPLIQLMFSEPNPAPLKAALAMQGVLREELRLPMTPATNGCKARIATMLEALDEVPVYTSAEVI